MFGTDAKCYFSTKYLHIELGSEATVAVETTLTQKSGIIQERGVPSALAVFASGSATVSAPATVGFHCINVKIQRLDIKLFQLSS